MVFLCRCVGAWRGAAILLVLATGCATVETRGTAGTGGGGTGGTGGLGGTPAPACDTQMAGAGEPHSNVQPSLALTYLIREAGVLPQDGPSDTDMVVGQVALFAGNFPPFGWLQANGQVLAIADHPDLFAALGIAHGGDGVTTFALPDLRGRAALFRGQGQGLSDRALGSLVGDDEAPLTSSQLATHAHGLEGTEETTAPSGDSEPTPVMQPSVALNAGIIRSGRYPSRGTGSNRGRFLGRMHVTAGELLPDDTYPADGALLSIASHDALFSIIGTFYGGDGRTTFGMPPLQGRVVVSAGSGAGLSDRPEGWIGGTEAVALEDSHLPAHEHLISATQTTDLSGGGQPYENVQPAIAMRYIIRTFGTFPSRDSGLNTDFIAEIGLFAGNFAPAEWAFLEGQVLPITGNESLFSIMGTTYGGDGRTTFALPDLSGRVPLGETGSGTEHPLGWSGGVEEVTLAESELAPHAHGIEPPASALVCDPPGD